MKKIFICFTLIFILTSCSLTDNTNIYDENKINITTTIFPYYDFTKAIVGNKANVSMLLPLGAESHTYEPSPKDILKINNSNLFICTGGESDSWIKNIFENTDNKDIKLINLIDVCSPIREDTHEHFDEHIWTSPKNAITIINKICEELCKIDPTNSNQYLSNKENYLKSIYELDEELKDIISNSKRNTLIFADRFPFIHLANDYNINYFSAFSSCTEHTEASIKTVTQLIDKINEENIPKVFYIEFSNQKLADTVCAQTNATKALLHSCHNISREDFEKGISYVELMKQNIHEIKEALN